MDDLQENNIRTEEQKVKRLPLTSDYVFKRIFAREENNSMLKDFLESILNIHINKVEVKNPELTPNMADEKLGILDLKLDIDNERVVDVEMQVSNEHNIKERSSTYLSKLAAEQLKAKQNYKELNKLSQNPEEVAKYEEREWSIMRYNVEMDTNRELGKEQGRKEGRKEGRKIGIEEGKRDKEIEIVKKLNSLNTPIEKIAEIVGLSTEEVKKIIG